MLEVNYMKNIFSKENLKGKSFAIAVCLCLLTVCATGIYSYYKVAGRLNDSLIRQNKDTFDNASVSEAAINEQPVDAAAPDVVKSTEAQTEKAPEETTAADTKTAELPEAASTASQVMIRPVNGEVLNEFSDGELVKSATLNVWKTHDGVDIAGEPGENVLSMTSGRVTKVYEDQLLGACVIIDHGSGIEGYYCNLSKDIPVMEGQEVSAGTVIGNVGDTAEGEIKEASHLHFALKKNGEWIDPVAMISGEGS